jgi:hypothetical protein
MNNTYILLSVLLMACALMFIKNSKLVKESQIRDLENSKLLKKLETQGIEFSKELQNTKNGFSKELQNNKKELQNNKNGLQIRDIENSKLLKIVETQEQKIRQMEVPLQEYMEIKKIEEEKQRAEKKRLLELTINKSNFEKLEKELIEAGCLISYPADYRDFKMNLKTIPNFKKKIFSTYLKKELIFNFEYLVKTDNLSMRVSEDLSNKTLEQAIIQLSKKLSYIHNLLCYSWFNNHEAPIHISSISCKNQFIMEKEKEGPYESYDVITSKKDIMTFSRGSPIYPLDHQAISSNIHNCFGNIKQQIEYSSFSGNLTSGSVIHDLDGVSLDDFTSISALYKVQMMPKRDLKHRPVAYFERLKKANCSIDNLENFKIIPKTKEEMEKE